MYVPNQEECTTIKQLLQILKISVFPISLLCISFVHHMIIWISFLSVSFFLVCFIAYFLKYVKFVGIILTGYT